MEQENDRLLTVGELSKRAGVTVRTLQYYDKCGLLTPEYSEGGRRVYKRDDIIRLQQILFLKSFGFSLEEIRDRLLHGESSAEFEAIFRQQKEVLLSQIDHLKKITKLMTKAIAEIHTDGEIGVDKLMAILELMRQGNPYGFIIRYFGNDQLKYLQNRFDDGDSAAEITLQQEKLRAELIELYRKGVNPTSPEGQDLAARWWQLVNAFTRGDPVLLQTLISAGMDVDNWPSEAGELRQAVKMFLESAFGEYFKNNTNLFPGLGVNRSGK